MLTPDELDELASDMSAAVARFQPAGELLQREERNIAAGGMDYLQARPDLQAACLEMVCGMSVIGNLAAEFRRHVNIINGLRN